jgi:hypothetical protein
MTLMLINVSTRKFGRAVRLPGGDVPAGPGAGRNRRNRVASSNYRRREILTVTHLGLPPELRRSLAHNIIENINGTIRRVCGNVKRWRDASMALRWTAAGMIR